MTVSLKQSAPYFYVNSNVRCQFITSSPLLHVFPCFPVLKKAKSTKMHFWNQLCWGCTEARLQRLNHILHPCSPAYLPQGQLASSSSSWRDTEASQTQLERLHLCSVSWSAPGSPPGWLWPKQSCLLSVWRSSRSTLSPSQTNSLLCPFFAWSNKMTDCFSHISKLEAVKHCMHQTGAFSFPYLSAGCR